MTKTEAMIGNLKLKECNSILEFLFSDFSAQKSSTETSSVKTNVQDAENAHILESDAKLKVMASICHEIKNPLNCIISYAELLCKNSQCLQEELKRYVENIRISSVQLKSLLLDVIESAKFEYGKMITKKQSFQTKSTIEDVLSVFERQFNDKNITVSSALIQANILADLTKFNQILYNLIGNAAKYTNQNGEINLVSWVEDDKFYFEIKNTGAFVNKSKAKKMFRIFCSEKKKETADTGCAKNTDKIANSTAKDIKNTTGQNEESSGMGLCISRELAEAIGGGLEFENTKRKTLFRVFIPVG